MVTLVPTRWRGERRSLRNFDVLSLFPSLAFDPDTPRRLSTPTDAFRLRPSLDPQYFDYWNPDAQREFVEMIQPPSGEESYASGALRGIEAVDKKTRLRLEASARAAAALDAMREVKRQDAEKAASAAAAAAAVAERERINAETATARAAAAVAEAKEHREKAAEEARAFYERSQLELKMKRELEDAQRELIAASKDLGASRLDLITS